jgi:flagellin
VTLQVGANQGDTITVSLVDLFGPGLNLVRPISFFTLPWLPADIAGLDAHISDVAAARGRIGAQSNRLEYTMDANSTLQSNLMEAESRIRDVDVAEEMTQLVRQRVLQSTGMAMLQKFNQRPSASRVLDLLGGD